jgi:NTP pyrophosphatase (non-canonical NTP hydrolase)
MQKTILPDKPNLTDLQSFVAAKCKERGWDKRSDVEKVMFLTEEVGEIAKEVRKHAGTFGYARPATPDDLAGELIDALNYLLDLANSNNIDLDAAFRAKWRATDSRHWS